jgi:hypothetical protein
VPARPMRPNVKYTVLISTAVQTPGPSLGYRSAGRRSYPRPAGSQDGCGIG